MTAAGKLPGSIHLDDGKVVLCYLQIEQKGSGAALVNITDRSPGSFLNRSILKLPLPSIGSLELRAVTARGVEECTIARTDGVAMPLLMFLPQDVPALLMCFMKHAELSIPQTRNDARVYTVRAHVSPAMPAPVTVGTTPTDVAADETNPRLKKAVQGGIVGAFFAVGAALVATYAMTRSPKGGASGDFLENTEIVYEHADRQGAIDLSPSNVNGEDTQLHIISAHYGSELQFDVTAAARAWVAERGGGRRLTSSVGMHEIWGDPQPGVHKTGRIVYMIRRAPPPYEATEDAVTAAEADEAALGEGDAAGVMSEADRQLLAGGATTSVVAAATGTPPTTPTAAQSGPYRVDIAPSPGPAPTPSPTTSGSAGSRAASGQAPAPAPAAAAPAPETAPPARPVVTVLPGNRGRPSQSRI